MRLLTTSYKYPALGAAVFNLIGTLFSFFFWRGVTTPSVFVFQLITLSTSLFTLIYLKGFQPKVSRFSGTVLYLINLAAILPMIWLANSASTALERPWAPFQSHKLAVMIYSMFVPPFLGLGFSVIFLFLAATLVQYLSFSSVVRSRLIEDEPWTTLIFILMGSLVLIMRIRTARVESRLIRARIQIATMRRLESRLFALKDLTNTPLQKMELDLTLLKKKCPNESIRIDRLIRTFQQLKDFNLFIRREGYKNQRSRNLSFNAKKRLGERS